MSFRFALWTPALLLGACASTRLPPHAQSSEYGVVRAADSGTAREHARILDEVAPAVAGALPGLEIVPVDLRVVGDISDIYRDSKHCAFLGATFESDSGKWVELRSDLGPGPRRGVLAHELVHLWLGPAWDTLPPSMEDGLADAVGEAIRGEETPSEKMRSFVACWITINGSLTLDQRAAPVDAEGAPYAIDFRGNIERLELPEILEAMDGDLVAYHSVEDPRRFAVVACLARRLMSRLTVDQLFDACRAAAEEGLKRVPIERIFAAAGVDPLDPAQWNELLLESYGPAEQQAFREEVDLPWEQCVPSEVAGVSIRREAIVDF